MIFARIDNGLVVELIRVADVDELAKRYHPDLVAQMVAADETVSTGQVYDGQGFSDPPGPALADVQAAALVAIDEQAEAVRESIITLGEGQMATYRRKEDQARAYVAATDPIEADYPALAKEVGITAPTLAKVAQVIIGMADAWWAFGDQIEGVRLKAKNDIRAAADVAGVEAVLSGLAWPGVPTS